MALIELKEVTKSYKRDAIEIPVLDRQSIEDWNLDCVALVRFRDFLQLDERHRLSSLHAHDAAIGQSGRRVQDDRFAGADAAFDFYLIETVRPERHGAAYRHAASDHPHD